MTRYRWLTAEGVPCSPLHRSPTTAGRWLARQARRPRTRPRPSCAVVERTTLAGHVRRRALTAPEAHALIAAVVDAGPGRVPASAERWLTRRALALRARERRQRALPKLTAHLTRRAS